MAAAQSAAAWDDLKERNRYRRECSRQGARVEYPAPRATIPRKSHADKVRSIGELQAGKRDAAGRVLNPENADFQID